MNALNRRGMALPLALFALVIAAALVSAVFYFARVEQRLGDNAVATAQAFEAAEAGTAQVMSNWQSATYNALLPGDSVQLAQVNLGGGSSYTGQLRRLTPTTFLLRAEGRLVKGPRVVTRSQLARLLRLNLPDIDISAAVTTRVGLNVTGSSQISGRDSVPGPWGAYCPPPGATVPGIRDSSGNVTTSGACSGASCITGTPPIQTDPTLTSNSFTQFGDISFTELAAAATKVVSGTVTGVSPSTLPGPPVSCNYGSSLNWGDPLNPLGKCFNYFPIIYAPGDLHMSGGLGQGILLVGGDLTVAGGFEFYGPAIVLGRVRSTGTGGHIIGGLMAGDADFSVSLLSGNSVVGYSSCAVNRALQGSATAIPLLERSWAQLY